MYIGIQKHKYGGNRDEKILIVYSCGGADFQLAAAITGPGGHLRHHRQLHMDPQWHGADHQRQLKLGNTYS